MAAPTVYQQVDEGVDLQGPGQLFAGKKFWVAQRVPCRIHLLGDIKANGGEIVLLEKLADYLIADHQLRMFCPPGSISYEFVEKSIKQGRLHDPEDHRCGPPLGEAREPGAINRPAKGGRAPYTAEEDRILYKWVKDHEAAGGLSSGNEIYKQLEAKHPRHPWQSWRDRYLKQLRSRPPSAFNIPDNAPPSPPSDRSNGPLSPVPSSSKQPKRSEPNKEQGQATKEVSVPAKARTNNEYTLDELAGLFSSEDWEQLYASVDIMDARVGDEQYRAAWAGYAEKQGKQAAEQWRQYYEKVVRPQWLRDPAWKREQIKKKHHLQDPEQDEDGEETGPVSTASKNKASPPHKPSESEDERFERLLNRRGRNDQTAAYTYFAREKKGSIWNADPGLNYTELHELLMSQWDSLSEEDQAPYIAIHAAKQKDAIDDPAKVSTEIKMLSSSTARHESPKYLADIYEKALKRIHGDDIVEKQEDQGESSRPTKRRKSASATPTVDYGAQQTDLIGTQVQPLEISSAEESSATSRSESVDDPSQEQIRLEMMQSLQTQNAIAAPDTKEAESVAESIESDEFPDIGRLPIPPEGHDTESADDLPSNTSTPRATRQKPSNFDTQAILSSPSQHTISAIPQPLDPQEFHARTDLQQSSSPPHDSESDASTTQSLQEFRGSLQGFRGSLNEEDTSKPAYSLLNSPLRNASLSPAPSSFSSTGSGDPDMPLEADDIDDFFNEQQENGIPSNFVVSALKRTRLRPGLAAQVLDAWKLGKPLPDQRGIWSVEDDVAVESGDGVALAMLERKHTMDGWGGVFERMRFLDDYRSR